MHYEFTSTGKCIRPFAACLAAISGPSVRLWRQLLPGVDLESYEREPKSLAKAPLLCLYCGFCLCLHFNSRLLNIPDGTY